MNGGSTPPVGFMNILAFLKTFHDFVVGNPSYLHYGLLPISGDTTIYRVEKRAIDCEHSRQWFGDNFDLNRQWKFVINSNDPLDKLLTKYVDTELYEFRIKIFNGDKNG